jgi:2-aminoadipate transaminase
MDLRFDGVPVPPLAALDANGLVVHLFSFSKSLFPGVRVGAITASGRAVDGLLALKHATDLSGALILQAAVAAFIRNGRYREHLERLRATLLERRDALLEALALHMPTGARWTTPEGGYQLWLELPDRVDTGLLLGEAQRAGVLYAPGYQFHHDARPSSSLRLTIALAQVDEIRRGVEILGGVVRRHLRGTSRRPRDTTIQL